MNFYPWAMYFRCCILQNIVMFFVFVIVRNWLLLYTNDQFRSSGSGTVTLDFFASFLAFKYSTRTFLSLNPFATIFLRKPCHIVSSLLSSLAVNSQDCALYNKLLRIQASRIMNRPEILETIIDLARPTDIFRIKTMKNRWVLKINFTSVLKKYCFL